MQCIGFVTFSCSVLMHDCSFSALKLHCFESFEQFFFSVTKYWICVMVQFNETCIVFIDTIEGSWLPNVVLEITQRY